MSTKIIASLIAIAAVAAVAGGATVAYFSDVESVKGNTFAAGTLDLTVDETANVTADFTNIKPGDSGTYEWTVVNAGSEKGYLDVEGIVKTDNENGCGSNSEKLVDADCDAITPTGELTSKIDVDIFVDVDGDGTNSAGDKLIYNGSLSGFVSTDLDYEMASGLNKVVIMNWSVATSVGNEIQSDKASLAMNFELGQTVGQ